VEYTVAQPFSDPCGVGVINAEPCPRELGREIPAPRRRVVLAACVLASSMSRADLRDLRGSRDCRVEQVLGLMGSEAGIERALGGRRPGDERGDK
jgi:hypothetical protein